MVHANLDHVPSSSIVGLIMRYITFNKIFEPHFSKYILKKFATHNLIFLIKKFSHVNINFILEYILEWNEPYYKHGIFSKWLIFSDILVQYNIYHILLSNDMIYDCNFLILMWQNNCKWFIITTMALPLKAIFWGNLFI